MTYVTHADLGGRTRALARSRRKGRAAVSCSLGGRGLSPHPRHGRPRLLDIDQSRAAREQQPGYLGMSYYEIWIGGLERLMADRDLVTSADLAAGHAVDPARPVARVLTARSRAGGARPRRADRAGGE